jgi:hypothetical protein
MKPDSQVRFCIIGLGNLMEVIWHCFTQSLGGDDLAQRAIATTADKDDLERKREVSKSRCSLEGNLEALKANRPDIIFFAPPPTIAPGEIDTTLRRVFCWAGQRAMPIPEIYAFPPMPPGQYYRDVHWVRMCWSATSSPTTSAKVAGQPVEGRGLLCLLSFTGDWPAESKERLLRIFASQGAMVEAPVTSWCPCWAAPAPFSALWQVVPVLAEILQKKAMTSSTTR